MPTFDEETLAVLEAWLGVSVPGAYFAFLDSFPPALAADRSIADHELFDDVAKVREANRHVREHPTWGEDCEQWWTASHLVIGCDVSGDVIFIDAASREDAVFRYLLETGSTLRIADDLHTYARMLETANPVMRRS